MRAGVKSSIRGAKGAKGSDPSIVSKETQYSDLTPSVPKIRAAYDASLHAKSVSAMQPTAGRSDSPLHFMKTRPLQSTLPPAAPELILVDTDDHA